MSVLTVAMQLGQAQASCRITNAICSHVGLETFTVEVLVSQASCVELETEKNITLEVLYHISIHQLVRASRIDF